MRFYNSLRRKKGKRPLSSALGPEQSYSTGCTNIQVMILTTYPGELSKNQNFNIKFMRKCAG